MLVSTSEGAIGSACLTQVFRMTGPGQMYRPDPGQGAGEKKKEKTTQVGRYFFGSSR